MQYQLLIPKSFILFFAFAITSVNATILSESLERIENNIHPKIQIVGEQLKPKRINQRLKELGTAGFSAAIAIDGKVVWAKGYGFADIEEKRKVDTSTLFQAASISKPIAALRALQLAEQGKIDLDADINNYLTSWKVTSPHFLTKEKVTTRRLLNHTAGISQWGFRGYLKTAPLPNTVDILEGRGNTQKIVVFREPGANWYYSGGGYTILQAMLSDIDKSSFPDLMYKHVLKPLGMNNSTFHTPLPKALHPMAATGYNLDGTPIAGKWRDHPEMAAAGLWTTPSELIKYATEIQRVKKHVSLDKKPFLSPKSLSDMLTPGKESHGLGPVINQYTFGHNGSNQGYKSELVAWLDQDYAIVAMTNSYNDTIIEEFIQAVASEFGLSGFEPRMFNSITLTKSEKQKFVGTYHIPDLGEITFTNTEYGLEATSTFNPKPFILKAETPTVFFNIATGTRFSFVIKGDKVVGFDTDRVSATKVNVQI